MPPSSAGSASICHAAKIARWPIELIMRLERRTDSPFASGIRQGGIITMTDRPIIDSKRGGVMTSQKSKVEEE